MADSRACARIGSVAGRGWLVSATLSLFAVLVLALVGPAAAAPDQPHLEYHRRLVALEAAIAADPAGLKSSATLLHEAGLRAQDPDVAEPPAPPGAASSAAPADAPPIIAGRFDLRLALLMLSQSHGTGDNNVVTAARGARGFDTLILREGRVGLADLRRLLDEHGLQRGAPDGPLALTVPVVVWPGAVLALGPGDAIHLSRPDGAFIVNFGHLEIVGARIEGRGGANIASPEFAPFLATADAGTLHVRDAALSGLGFGNTAKFAGLSVLRSPLYAAPRPSRIEASRFTGLHGVAIDGDRGAQVRGNRFSDMGNAALELARSPRTTIAGNVFSGAMPTNAIRVLGGSGRTQVTDNLVLGGVRAGIAVRDAGRGVTVARNIVWRREGGGISLSQSRCGTVRGNIVLGNAQKGIEIRSAVGARVSDNIVLDNHSAGIWVSAQPAGTVTRVAGNVLSANGSGLAAATGARIHLERNDFTRQFPQFLSGDLARQSVHLARDLSCAVPIVLTAAGPFTDPVAPEDCHDRPQE